MNLFNSSSSSPVPVPFGLLSGLSVLVTKLNVALSFKLKEVWRVAVHKC